MPSTYKLKYCIPIYATRFPRPRVTTDTRRRRAMRLVALCCDTLGDAYCEERRAGTEPIDSPYCNFEKHVYCISNAPIHQRHNSGTDLCHSL